MITFLVSGLWHGANWTYVIWGGLHGAYQVVKVTINLECEKHRCRHNVYSGIRHIIIINRSYYNRYPVRNHYFLEIQRQKKCILTACILFSVWILFLFKYFNMFMDTAVALGGLR